MTEREEIDARLAEATAADPEADELVLRSRIAWTVRQERKRRAETAGVAGPEPASSYFKSNEPTAGPPAESLDQKLNRLGIKLGKDLFK